MGPASGALLLLLLAACGGRGATAQSLAGVYALDRVAYRRTLLPDPLPQDPEQLAEVLASARSESERIDVLLRLESDGSFLVRARYDQEEVRLRGAWTRRGDRIRLQSTHSPAGRVEGAEPIEARLEGDALGFPAGVVPRPFLLRRR